MVRYPQKYWERQSPWKKSMHGWTAFHLELVRSLLIPETGRGRDVQIHESPVMLEVKILLET
jgi:hypothetical protein